MLLLLAALGLTACQDKDAALRLAALADADSQARLENIPADANVLLSLHGKHRLGELPELGPDGRTLSQFDQSVLVALPRRDLPLLLDVEALDRIVVWGSEAHADRLEPQLRLTLLARLSDENLRPQRLPVIGTFRDPTPNLRTELTATGAIPRSVVGPIATLDATVDQIFEILARADLARLSKPVLQRPLPAE